ncbi:MAG: sigma-E factor negative regulatory protein [Gammaproteobacteria bacterium]|nr:sigma-E factor negative regulatory protein [Gammaproteobacteria bacterium]
MSERLRESLSALMDDEADDLELGRILRAMDSGEADLAGTWSRYQLVSAVLKGRPGAVGLRPLALDLATADVDAADSLADDVLGDARSSEAGVLSESRNRGRRALGSFAVAASLTAVAVVGWQWQVGGEVESVQMASGAQSLAPATAPASSALPLLRPADQRGLLQASESGRATRDAGRAQLSTASPSAGDVDMRQRVEAYMVRHAEHNALHSRSGMMPFARMAAFDGAQ